ncbi:protein FAM200C-like [Watersipora subatra]|uniref:protein FAM200C-like n=1 Tax=Watersipora subatra TaxID=2589382 RepID=UPI00355C2BCD
MACFWSDIFLSRLRALSQLSACLADSLNLARRPLNTASRNKKPHTIGETLVKACLLECTKIILGDTTAQKIADLSVSDSTVKSRINDMSADIKRQVIEKIKSSHIFDIQLDEFTDVASISQLMVFARYVHIETIEGKFLFCSLLTETTTVADDMNLVSNFFSK